MGTWNVSLFGNDLASDLRGEYRDLLGQGLTGEQATDKLLEEYASVLQEPEDAPVFWLALAATQWKCGRLEARIREQALAVIDSGADLAQWDDEKLRVKRQAVLAELRKQLHSPQPKLSKIRKRKLATCDWPPSEIIQYHVETGEYVVFRVDQLFSDKGGTYPDCTLLDHWAKEPPSESAIRSLPCLQRIGHDDVGKPCLTWFGFMLCGADKLPVNRVTRTGIKLEKPNRRGNFSQRILGVKEFDQFLRDMFSLPKGPQLSDL